MDHIFITQKIESNDVPVDGLIKRIADGLLTPDMAAATAAGCRFEVEMKQKGEEVIFTMRTIEKVSILKTPDGTPVSVLIRR